MQSVDTIQILRRLIGVWSYLNRLPDSRFRKLPDLELEIRCSIQTELLAQLIAELRSMI